MLPLNPADPYDEILDPSKNLLPGIEAQPWDKVHTGITLVGSIPNSTLGEKVLHELLLASMDRMGIFTLGRVEMYMFCYKDAVKVNKRIIPTCFVSSFCNTYTDYVFLRWTNLSFIATGRGTGNAVAQQSDTFGGGRSRDHTIDETRIGTFPSAIRLPTTSVDSP